ncbi:MAG: hypothetical protein ACI8ZB_002119 [Desulforhopalus sp.]|jgi:hypothetical protein
MVSNKSRRIIRETKTIQAMVSLYCRNHHHPRDLKLCTECKTVQDYSIRRLHHCPFLENKPTCANCLVHCYKKDMRDKVREIMRYSGPRLLVLHPFLAISHILDGRIKPHPLKRSTADTTKNIKQ